MPSRRFIHLLITLVVGVLADAAIAEELIGVEVDGDAGDVESSEEPSTNASNAELPRRQRTSVATENGGLDAGDFTVSGSLGANNRGVFGGNIVIGYYFNRYLGLDTSYAYYQVQGVNEQGVQYGPAVDLVGRLPNPTILTPFAGVGIGYLKWQRRDEGETFDAGASGTGSVFGGADVRLTDNFGLQLERRQLTYFKDPPRRFGQPTEREAKSRVITNLGFYMRF